MLKQYQLLFAVTILSVPGLHSQYYFYDDQYYNSSLLIETGFSGGAFNCLTDLGGGKGHGKPFVKDINWSNTHHGGGFYLVVLFEQVLGLRVEGSFGKISAFDNILKGDHSEAVDRFNRNLAFESNLGELAMVVEFHPVSCFARESHPLFSPYMLAGIGMFRFNPRTKLGGQWIFLHPLHTEGQGFKEYPHKDPYKLTQINFPVGLGWKYEISAILNARVEIVYRFLTTDYLDDVSTQYIDPGHFHSNLKPFDALSAIALADRSGEVQSGISNPEGAIRGNPANRDAYFSFNIKLGVILNRKHR